MCGGKASHAQGHPQQHIYSENTFVLHVPLSVNGRVPRQAVTCHVELFDILIDRRVWHTLVPSTTEAPKSHSETTYVCIKTFFHPYMMTGSSAYDRIGIAAPASEGASAPCTFLFNSSNSSKKGRRDVGLYGHPWFNSGGTGKRICEPISRPYTSIVITVHCL
jgi:hypothetical protein